MHCAPWACPRSWSCMPAKAITSANPNTAATCWNARWRGSRHTSARRNTDVAGPINPSTPFPCGSFRAYGECCGALLAGTPAADAEHLMRARYCAYVLQREDYLLDTWHPETRPMALHLAAQQPAPTWLGLHVREHVV